MDQIRRRRIVTCARRSRSNSRHIGWVIQGLVVLFTNILGGCARANIGQCLRTRRARCTVAWRYGTWHAITLVISISTLKTRRSRNVLLQDYTYAFQWLSCPRSPSPWRILLEDRGGEGQGSRPKIEKWYNILSYGRVIALHGVCLLGGNRAVLYAEEWTNKL